MKLKITPFYAPEDESGTPPAPTEVPTDAPTDAPIEPTSWRSALPEDLRENPNFAKYSSLESFAKGHINAVSQLGQDRIVIPKTDDEWSEVYGKLGRPADSASYELPQMDVDPSIKEYVESRVGSYKELSHQIGLSNNQASALHQWFLEGNNERATADSDKATAELEAAHDLLKGEWGNAYESNMLASKNAIKEFGSEELVAFLDDTGMGNNPHLIRAFEKIGTAMMGEKRLEGQGEGGISPDQAKASITEIMAKPEYWDADSLERPELVRKVAKLMEQAHPNKNT